MVTNLSRQMEMSAARNLEAVSRFNATQNAAWTHPPWERGNLDIILDELGRRDRDRLERQMD